MTPDERNRIESIFEAALDLPAARRAAFLDAECAGEPSVRREIEALLAAHDRRSGILDDDVAALASSLLESDGPGSHIGPYRIVRLLGRGGMGDVHLAERDDGQFRRTVAIKVIRGGPEPLELNRRLEAERQILASLDHPNIARLFDGGLLPDGRPYLVMEYIEGEPIDRYCDSRRLTLEERLRLFCDIAHAVHYAHRSLIVHRDLKPSNILVASDGVPRLLDFGIAKVLDASPLAGGAPETRTGLRLMTPEYASPEQVRGATVTTANDVYALGVVLFELLAGRRPFVLAGRPASVAERIILWQNPPRPSALFLRTAAGGDAAKADAAIAAWPDLDAAVAGDQTDENDWSAARAATARRTTPQRLARSLSGGLDRIALMALRKEPERRYASAEQLAEDVERHLEGRPVIARGESAVHRTRKFITRHRYAVLAAALLALTLIGGIVATATQARRASLQRMRAEQEAEKASRVASVMMDLFRLSDPNETLGDTITAREVLDRGTERILREFDDQPDVQAMLLGEVARVYANLGLFSRAEPLVRRSIELHELTIGASSIEVAAGLGQLGRILATAGRNDDAIAAFRSGIAIHEALGTPADSLLIAMQTGLAWELRAKGRHDEAAALFQRALDAQIALFGNDAPQLAPALLGLAASLHDRGRFDEAESLFRRVLSRSDRGLEQPHPLAATALLNVGMIRRIREQYIDAAPLVASALEMRLALYEADHPLVLQAIAEYGIVLDRLGRFAESERVLEDGIARALRSLGAEHPTVVTLRSAYGTTLSQTGRYAAALAQFDTVLAMQRSMHAAQDHPELEFTMIRSGEPLIALGRLDEAERRFREAAAMGDRGSGPERVYKALALQGHARVAAARGRTHDALRDYDAALTMAARLLRADHRYVLSIRRDRAAALIDTGSVDIAITELEAVLAVERTSLPSPHPNRARTLFLLGKAHIAGGNASRAEALLRESLNDMRELPGNHSLRNEANRLLAGARG